MVAVYDGYNKVEINGGMSTTKLIEPRLETGVAKDNTLIHITFSKKKKIDLHGKGWGAPQTFGGGQIFPNKSSTRLAWSI